MDNTLIITFGLWLVFCIVIFIAHEVLMVAKGAKHTWTWARTIFWFIKKRLPK